MDTQQQNHTTQQIAAGWYDGRAKSWRWTQAKTGTWQLEIVFEVSDRSGSLGECIGWFAITDNTIEKRVEQFTTLGCELKTGDLGKDIGCDEQGCWGDLNRNAVRIYVEHDDRGRARVNNISKGNGRQTVDPGALSAFGAQMRGAVLAAVARANEGAHQAPARSAAPQQRPAPASARPTPAPASATQQRPAPRPAGFAQPLQAPEEDDQIPF